jgi:hypothetical protein
MPTQAEGRHSSKKPAQILRADFRHSEYAYEIAENFPCGTAAARRLPFRNLFR